MSDGKNRQSLLLPILIPLGALAVIALVLIGFSRVLLAVSHNAATVVALVAAAGIVGVAAWVASRKRVTGATLFSMVAAMTGIAMVAGGLAVVAAPLQAEEEEVIVALSAPEGAAASGFAADALSVPSAEPFTIAFDNADPVQHNVVIFDGPDADSPSLFEGALLTGPAEALYSVEPLAEGEYFFNCEIHPATMTGTMTAAPGGGEGGGGEGVTVAAQALEFDTDTIELPAETPTTITFDNQEAGIQHNIAIYGDDSLAEELFKGELVTGPTSVPYPVPPLPKGEYFFQCDVHPTMTGTVIVAAGGGGAEGGGSGPGEEEPPPDEGGGGATATASVVAENTAFVPTTLAWAADTEVALTFDNRDPADIVGLHNVSIYSGETVIFQGELVPGPTTIEYPIPPMQTGTFEFRCDVHPEMIGTVEVT